MAACDLMYEQINRTAPQRILLRICMEWKESMRAINMRGNSVCCTEKK